MKHDKTTNARFGLSLEAGGNQEAYHRGLEFPEKIKRIGANFDNFQSLTI